MNPGLRAELLRRMERDQAARRADDPEAFEQVDAENLPWLKKVITETGWPGRSIVGDDGAIAAWTTSFPAWPWIRPRPARARAWA